MARRKSSIAQEISDFANAYGSISRSIDNSRYLALQEQLLKERLGRERAKADAPAEINRTIDRFTPPAGASVGQSNAEHGAGGSYDPSKAPPYLAKIAAQHGVSPDYMSRVAWIESKFNPLAHAKSSSAGGLFQFTDGTARKYGLTNKLDGEASADAAARLASDNARTLKGVLGRDPTDAELYLAHQQGATGAAQLLRNSSTPAIAIVGRDAVINNGGNVRMTAGDFAHMWLNKYDSLGGNTGGNVASAQGSDQVGAQEAKGAAPTPPTRPDELAPTYDAGTPTLGYAPFEEPAQMAALPEFDLGFADGGLVDEGAYDAGGYGDGAYGQSNDSSGQYPAAGYSNPLEGLANGVGEALHRGLSFLQETFGFTSNEALPSQENQDRARAAVAGEGWGDYQGALNDDEARMLGSAIDPNGELSEGMRLAAGMTRAFDFYTSRGEMDKAGMVAARTIQYGRILAARHADEAGRLLSQGKTGEALQAAERAFDSLPNGQNATLRPNRDGTVAAMISDANGRIVKQANVTPQQLIAMAAGVRDGTAYYRALMDAAAGRITPEKEEPRESVASQAYWNAQAGGTPQGGGQAPQAAGGQTPRALPIEANEAMARAASSEGALGNGARTPVPQAQQSLVNQALAAFDARNPEPRLPRDFDQLAPHERAGIRADVIQRRQSWWRARTEIAKQAHEAEAQGARLQHEQRMEEAKLNAPPSIADRRGVAADIADAMETYKQTLPKGVTLSAPDERALRMAAGHIAMDRRNAISAEEAVDAAVDLVDPRNGALDRAKVGDNGLASLSLRNGTSVLLNQQAIGALKKLRGDKLAALKQQELDKKNAFGPRAARALGTMAEGAAGVAGDLTRTYSPLSQQNELLMEGLWRAYQQATGNQ